MDAPSIALCIPAYNASGHLPRLLESAKNQTTAFDQVVVYDDCSTDNTADVARSYGAEVLSGEENQGPSVSRKRLAQHVSTDWIHFHDADDAMCPNFVEQAREWMTQEDPPDVVLFGYEERDAETDRTIGVRRFDGESLRVDPVRQTIKSVINPFCGLYYRPSFLAAGGPDTDPDVLYNEDAAMHCKLARAGLQFDADPSITVIRYKQQQSMSQSNFMECEKARYHVLKKYAHHNGDAYPETIARQLWQNATMLASGLEWEVADKAIQLAMELDGRIPEEESQLFQMLCSVHPRMAFRIREKLIRLFKPSLRES